MNKKILTKVLSVLLSASCLLATTSALNASADDTIGNSDTNTQIFILNEDDNGQPPVYYGDDGIMPYGQYIPSSSAVVDLSYNSPYVAHIESFEHRIYTNVMFTGASGMVVSLTGNDTMISEYLNGDSSREITFSIYKYNSSANDSLVDSFTISKGLTMGLLNLYPLDAYSKYYVRVDKTQDGISLYNLNINVNKSC